MFPLPPYQHFIVVLYKDLKIKNNTNNTNNFSSSGTNYTQTTNSNYHFGTLLAHLQSRHHVYRLLALAFVAGVI